MAKATWQQPTRAVVDRQLDRPDRLALAAALRDIGHGPLVTYSRKVFIPLTRMCRDVCSYCTFARPPRRGPSNYLSPDEVLAIARAGAAAGCDEALFTLGERPELRYAAARDELSRLGYGTTIEYLAAMCRLVLAETGLLPHANPGTMDAAEIALLRPVAASMGMMMESASPRLGERGGPHFGSPDKHPAVRLETIRLAGEARVPFTSGILIGIGETRAERLDSLFALRDLHERHGHIQEIIVQNFRAKPDTRMKDAAEPDLAELQWTIAAARLILGPEMSIQAPPNLSGDEYGALLDAGINDWGGVSPVTPDHVNPEAPWPHIAALRRETAARGKTLAERLTIYPRYALALDTWADGTVAPAIRRLSDAAGLARADGWVAGGLVEPAIGPTAPALERPVDPRIADAIAKASDGIALGETEIATLFTARGPDFDAVRGSADELRRAMVGERVGYVVNRNINYTNVCAYRCGFCAFSKGKTSAALRGRPYDLALEEVARRAREAWDRGATEVCMQGGIHPDYTGETYLELCRAVKDAVPGMHVHAFSPLEVTHGARTTGTSVHAFLERLRDAGLGSLPGTAAEILDDPVRDIICPDKLRTAEWLDVVAAAHSVGLRTTATIMYGHTETIGSWARHLLRIRDLQERTGRITEFVPLPFVHTEAPLYLHGRARRGPTFREAVLMHAVARLVLHPLIVNIQVSWVKMGPSGVVACLRAGANDLGGTLMN
ncbi:MAG TPA: 7,8-didemethyl-8-hydroxy-5-deazariboflavin synthase CofG, partial [Stellaceae bacterium]|nr:7,8-didemethyl-8-hydroxy-5-deazariboflavin synthase CofG [Stellaceae bacterium]